VSRSWARLVVLGAAITLAACGGGSSNDRADAPATTRLSDTQSAGTGPPDTNFTGAGSGDYCRLARAYATSAQKFTAPTNAAELRQVFADASRDINAAAAVAPAEIKADVQVVAQGLSAIIAGMEAADYDLTRLATTPPSLPPNFDAASVRLEAYARDVCGLRG
jgi:ABC-type glycerol-3-phosphate transport system substrate-binding protein